MEIKITPSKTYATRENAVKAAEKINYQGVRYIVLKDEDSRYYPVFVGNDAIHNQVFRTHCVIN